MVIVLAAHVADTPAGNPFAPDTPSLDIPVAPVVVCVILGLIAVLIQSVGVEDAEPAVLTAEIVTEAVASTAAQPPRAAIW
jgi:hypothetical protein